MGATGPVPNRDQDLARDRNRNGRDIPEASHGLLQPVQIPDMDENWHPIAKMVYESARTSGQNEWYQNSDWAILWSLCEDLSHYKSGSKGVDKLTGELYEKARSGQMLQTIMSTMTSLLLTEGERRRVRIELQKPEPEKQSAAVLAIADYQRGLEEDD